MNGVIHYNKDSVNGRYTLGTTATRSCNSGYRSTGPSMRTCQASGNWDGEIQSCEQSKEMKIIFCFLVNISNTIQYFNLGFSQPFIGNSVKFSPTWHDDSYMLKILMSQFQSNSHSVHNVKQNLRFQSKRSFSFW